jgi:hypothetical protein
VSVLGWIGGDDDEQLEALVRFHDHFPSLPVVSHDSIAYPPIAAALYLETSTSLWAQDLFRNKLAARIIVTFVPVPERVDNAELQTHRSLAIPLMRAE